MNYTSNDCGDFFGRVLTLLMFASAAGVIYSEFIPPVRMWTP
jgi:hypothetical protein